MCAYMSRIFSCSNRRAIVITVAILITSIVSFMILSREFSQKIFPESTASPSPSPTAASSTPFSSPKATSTPNLTPKQTVVPNYTKNPTQTPNPTYLPYMQVYSNFGYIYVTGVEIFGGDLEGNTIHWNPMYIGSSENTSFYVRSISNVPVILGYSVTGWDPPGINSFLNLSWNYDQEPLLRNQTIFLTLTLSSQSSSDFANYLVTNNVTAFSFTIEISSYKASSP
jgi:hypothetical protein